MVEPRAVWNTAHLKLNGDLPPYPEMGLVAPVIRVIDGDSLAAGDVGEIKTINASTTCSSVRMQDIGEKEEKRKEGKKKNKERGGGG